MVLKELIQAFLQEKKAQPTSPNELLDYCQNKYIHGMIEIKVYRHLFQHLHEQGATSAHELTLD